MATSGTRMDVDEEFRMLLAEQRQELAYAQSMDSDLHYAYRLQLHEALDASHSSSSPLPSSSSSSQFHTLAPDDNFVSDSLAYLQAEEFARFEQECADRECAEAEFRRARDELNRFIHDQTFASKLLRVPEEEWSKTGDHFHLPYGEGSSSSSSSASSGHVLKLYFKGLVSEETRGDSKSTLAGIGVAICDANGGLLFELKKPLVGDDNSGEVVDLKALIEGLNVAKLLSLTKITVVFDDISLFNYVTGKARPLLSNTENLIDQVSHIQRGFTQCNLSLVARKDVKFVFKLATDAIVSQVTSDKGRELRKDLLENCTICFEDCNAGRMFSVNNCLHRYCFSCMKQYVEVQLLKGALPKCPHEGCKSELKGDNCKIFLSPYLYDLMTEREKEASIPVTDKIYCPYLRCSALMSKAELVQISLEGRDANFVKFGFGAIKCTRCHGIFCISCKVPWHSNMTCYEYKEKNPSPCTEDAKLKSLANKKFWRQCVKCKHMVELAQGCYHIYCRCGHEFCYTCGAEWRNKKATCRCPIWDERNIIYDRNNEQRQ